MIKANSYRAAFEFGPSVRKLMCSYIKEGSILMRNESLISGVLFFPVDLQR